MLKERSGPSYLDAAEEGGPGDLLVVKEDLYLVGDGLLGGEGHKALPTTQHLHRIRS